MSPPSTPTWKGSPSRALPAPPITTSSPHLLLGAAPTPTRSSHRSSTSSLAASHLARQMAEMNAPPGGGNGVDDDKASIRSGKTLMMSGERRRVGSLNSERTVRLGRESEGSLRGGSIRERKESERSGSSSRGGKEEEVKPIERPEEGSTGMVPQVVKRQRVEDVDPPQLQDNGKGKGKGKLLTPPSSSASTISTQTTPSLSKRESWFGSSSTATATASTSSPIRNNATPNPPLTPTPTATRTPTPLPSPTSTPTLLPFPSPSLPPPPEPTPSPATPRLKNPNATSDSPRRASWFGGGARVLPPPTPPGFVMSDGGYWDGEGIREEDEGGSLRGTIRGRGGGSISGTIRDEGGSTPKITPSEEEPPTKEGGGEEDEATTPQPTPRSNPLSSTTSQQRVSWWGWGYLIPDPEVPPLEEEHHAPELSTSTSTTSESSGGGEGGSETSSISTFEGRKREVRTRASAKRSWLQTIWGGEDGTTEEDSEGVKEEETTTDQPTHEQEISERTEAVKLAPVSLHDPPKLRASWAFFPTRRVESSSSFTPAPPDSTPSSLLPTKPLSTLTKSLASSRASSIASSTPPSPKLLPQSDAPLKPLTGSLRNSPRDPEAPIENLVLPTFHDTFLRPPRSFEPKKGKLGKAVSLVGAYFFNQPPMAVAEHGGERLLPRLKEDPAEKLPKSLMVMGGQVKVELPRRVVTIGVHGWFPTPMVRSVFGEPTGTSIKFSTMMHDAVQSYLESHDVNSFNIQAIALEGEGQVDSRVERLFQQLSNRSEWVDALKKADVVFLATHSQGSVVSTQLLARMVKAGVVAGGRTHLLAMCAISQGPFVYLNQSYALQPYFNYIESAAARELFEFQDPTSVVTIKFLESLQLILSHGVKITVVGSINDQVTPLYSSLFAGISHPAILRAVYIDSAAFRTSDFLANLVVFASRLRNAGLKDHDLVYHISEALAGALTGVGHSKIYEEEEVFKLAVRYQFETTALADAPTFLNTSSLTPAPPLTMSFNPRERRNPYLLTWALRGIIEDPQIRELFTNELIALREAFETWKPTTKVLKDVKLKLEGIRMLPLRVGGGGKKEGKL